MKIAVGCDHVALDFKKDLEAYLEVLGHTYEDLGAYSAERTDYPLWAEKVARAVAAGSCDRGLLLCGSGVGMSIAANKVHGIRAVVCSEPYSAILSRRHNNTNVLCLGARVLGIELAKMILAGWLEASFEGGRHQGRIDLITGLEKAEGRT